MTIALPDGREIYVAGLRTWTVDMIRDSLLRRGESLTSDACAATLRYELGFADASAITLRMGPERPPVVFIDVREPGDSARVKYRLTRLDTTRARKEWLPVTRVLLESRADFERGVEAFLGNPRLLRSDTVPARVAEFFNARRAPKDRQDALQTLARSPNYADRTVAALMLANFPDGTEVWKALLDAMRETDGPVRAAAARSLKSVARAGGRAPDWISLAPSIHPILDGTSLFVLDDLIAILNWRPDVGPTFAGPFLARGGEMLLNFAAHPHYFRYEPARALLFKLRGVDSMDDVAAWRVWVLGLRADGATIPKPKSKSPVD